MSSFTFNRRNLKNGLNKLFDYLAEVQESGRPVFISYQGHVDNFDIHIAVSEENYSEHIFDGGYPTLQYYLEPEEGEIVEVVDTLIAEIILAIDVQDKKEEELRTLAELKAKYEPEEKKEEDADLPV